MSQGTVLVGTDKVLANLNKEIRRIKGKTRVGMKASLDLIKGRSQALTPVDTTNLRAGQFTDVEETKNGIIGVVGAQAAYAIFVHEILENKHEVGQAKFLETAVKQSTREILKLITRFAKV